MVTLENPFPASIETVAKLSYASLAALKQSSSYKLWYRTTGCSLRALVAKS